MQVSQCNSCNVSIRELNYNFKTYHHTFSRYDVCLILYISFSCVSNNWDKLEIVVKCTYPSDQWINHKFSVTIAVLLYFILSLAIEYLLYFILCVDINSLNWAFLSILVMNTSYLFQSDVSHIYISLTSNQTLSIWYLE